MTNWRFDGSVQPRCRGLYNDYIKFCKQPLTNFLEIGANHFQDSLFFYENYCKEVWGIEASPKNFQESKTIFPGIENLIKMYNFAASSTEDEVEFCEYTSGGGDVNHIRKGHIFDSTFGTHFNVIKVPQKPVGEFIIENDIKEIDFCKIDVEGFGYDTLKSFGKFWKMPKVYQIEIQTKPWFEGDKGTYDNLKGFLETDYIECYNKVFHQGIGNNDILYVRKDFYKGQTN